MLTASVSNKSGYSRMAMVLAYLHLAALLVQPIFAGLILSGSEFDSLEAHLWNGRLIVFLAAALLAASLTCRRYRVGAAITPVLAAVLLASEITQFFLGYAGNLALHVPLGVAIAVLASLCAFVATVREG